VNFAYLLLDNINKYGEYMLLNYEDQEYTNTDLERLSNRLGRGLNIPTRIWSGFPTVWVADY